MKEYHVLIQGIQSGPFPESAIQLKILSGELNADDLCWTDGLAEWQAVHSVITLPLTTQPAPPPETAASGSHLQDAHPTQSETIVPQAKGFIRKISMRNMNGVHFKKPAIILAAIAAVTILFAIAIALFCATGIFWNQSAHEETVTLTALEGPYPIIGDSVENNTKRLGASSKLSEPDDKGLSSLSVVCSNWRSGFTVSFSGDTAVGFVYTPLKNLMDAREQEEKCSQKYAARVKASVISAYKNTKGITERGGQYFDQHDHLLNFVAFDNGSMWAYAMEYESKMGIISWTETKHSK